MASIATNEKGRLNDDGLFGYGGEGGIRTPGTLASTPHFECGPINHSGTSPEFGAADENRTRDPQLGKLMLYHLSYYRTKQGCKDTVPTGIKQAGFLTFICGRFLP